MNILLLSRYDQLGASSRIRFLQYLPYLRDRGLRVEKAPLLPDEYLRNLYAAHRRDLRAVGGGYWRRLLTLINKRRFDLLWIEKEIFPWMPACFEKRLQRLGIPMVVDYDDAVFHNYDMHASALIRLLLGRKIDRVMRRASLVTAGNGYLARRAEGAGAPRVERLPSVVDLKRYPAKDGCRNERLAIGWIGSPTTAGYLLSVAPALEEVCGGGRARVIVVGSGPIGLHGLSCEVREWSEETEVADILDFDMGIMPLPDSPWTRGKCGYKLIQYMACGLPVVASPAGVNREIVTHGETGFLAEKTSDWVQALETLGRNMDLRISMGRKARQCVEQKYSLQVTAPRVYSMLMSAARGRL